jgi:predicted RNA-binding protein with RPS1 domain
MENEIKKEIDPSMFFNLADDIVAIGNEINMIAVIGISKDGHTHLSVSKANREQHSLMAREMIKAGEAILKDLAITCQCHECNIGNKVH